jgi:HD-like signal output (HDOD) protein
MVLRGKLRGRVGHRPLHLSKPTTLVGFLLFPHTLTKQRDKQSMPTAANIQDLAPLSPASLRLLRLPLGRSTPLTVYVDAIQSDPILTARVLSMANSPLFGLRQPVSSILQAVGVLGQDRLNALVALLAFQKVAHSQTKSAALQKFWRHSIATAVVVESLYPDQSECYVLALLHDLGALNFLQLDSSFYDDPEDLGAKELERFSRTHSAEGARLMKQWNLPAPFVNVAEQHTDLNPATEEARLVQRASAIASHMGFSFHVPEIANVEYPSDLENTVSQRVNQLEKALN